MIAKPALDSLNYNLNNLDKITYGGLKGMLFGNPIRVKALSEPEATPSAELEGDIAIVNVCGILMKNVDEDVEMMLGLLNIDRISFTLDTLANDPTVSHIILNFDSPGGETTGIYELGQKIKDIDTNIKPIYSWSENQMDSAAYWLGSQARLIGMSPSANVGNVGVYILTPDESMKNENEGTRIQEIFSGKWKMMGHSHRSLTDEEKAYLQADVNKQHQMFKDIVKANRPEIKDEALEGLSYNGEDAFNLGLADIVCNSMAEFAVAIL
jgi:signal peptide peptidase SppA